MTNQTSMTGPEQAADDAGAAALDEEQDDEDDDGQRHDGAIELLAQIFRPSIALRTEIAGVIVPSP